MGVIQESAVPELLFVYGTLKRDWLEQPWLWPVATHTQLQPIARSLLALPWLGEAQTTGMLYRVSHYPAFVPAGGGIVYGELYQLPDSGECASALLHLLDEYEECSAQDPQPHEYRREQILVTDAAGNAQQAWTYCYNRSAADLMAIADGVFSVGNHQP